MTDKMPPLPPPFFTLPTKALTAEGVHVWASDQMHAYARQHAEEVAGPLVEALAELIAHSDEHDGDNAEEECPICEAVAAARAALAAYKEHAA